MPCVVLLDALLGDAPADQRADDAAGRRTGAGAGDRRRERAGDDEAEPRQRDGRADRGDGRGDGAEAAADRAADARAFGRLRAELGLAAVARAAEVTLARVVGHHDVDVVARVAAIGDRLVGALGAVAIAEEAGQHRVCWCSSASLLVVGPRGEHGAASDGRRSGSRRSGGRLAGADASARSYSERRASVPERISAARAAGCQEVAHQRHGEHQAGRRGERHRQHRSGGAHRPGAGEQREVARRRRA